MSYHAMSLYFQENDITVKLLIFSFSYTILYTVSVYRKTSSHRVLTGSCPYGHDCCHLGKINCQCLFANEANLNRVPLSLIR